MTADSHRTMSRPIAIALTPPIVGAPVKMSRASTACALLFACSQAFGGIAASGVESAKEEFNPERFEVAIESGYLFGFINPPRSYQIGAEFLTARVRWGVVRSDMWLRGYNQFYISAIADFPRNREPLFRTQLRHALQLRPTAEPARSLHFRRAWFRMDR